MLRRDSSFRISKQTKRSMAMINDKDRRNDYKESMIKAQIEGSKVISKKSKEGKDSDES